MKKKGSTSVRDEYSSWMKKQADPILRAAVSDSGKGGADKPQAAIPIPSNQLRGSLSAPSPRVPSAMSLGPVSPTSRSSLTTQDSQQNLDSGRGSESRASVTNMGAAQGMVKTLNKNPLAPKKDPNADYQL